MGRNCNTRWYKWRPRLAPGGNWKKEYLELSGPRGIDFPPMDLEAVRGHRWVLHVTVPPAEPASKRRRRD